MANLKKLMKARLKMRFPDNIEKDLGYGEVDPVLIDADLYGWALQSSENQLSPEDASRLRNARNKLIRSLDRFPPPARTYYESLVELASVALDRAEGAVGVFKQFMEVGATRILWTAPRKRSQENLLPKEFTAGE
jgi:hypothetical protein